MNPRQLEAFRATIRAGSVTAAATALGITRPSVSRLIAELERSVGFALFVRQGRRNVATAQARKLYQAVESMFIGIDRIRGTAAAIRNSSDECVDLGVIPALVQEVVPQAVAELRRDEPTLGVEIRVLNTVEIVDAVLLHQIDVGVINPTRDHKGLSVLYELRTRHVCLVPEEHALANDPGPIGLDALAEEELVTFDAGLLKELGVDEATTDRLTGRPRVFSRSDPAIAALAKAIRAIAIVDRFTARSTIARGGMMSRPLIEDLAYPVAIVVRDEANLSLAAKRLADVLSDAFTRDYELLPARG